jgi:hypothetical protein
MKIECGCCYNDECSFVCELSSAVNNKSIYHALTGKGTMIQCSDAHLFCADCVRAQAGVAVGSRQRVRCISHFRYISSC